MIKRESEKGKKTIEKNTIKRGVVRGKASMNKRKCAGISRRKREKENLRKSQTEIKQEE